MPDKNPNQDPKTPDLGFTRGLQDRVYNTDTINLNSKELDLIKLAIEHRDKSLTLTQFANLQNRTRQALNKSLNRLEKKGLIKRDNLGFITTLEVPKEVENALKIGGALSAQGFTSRRGFPIAHLDDVEVSVPYSINPVYVSQFDDNEFWEIGEYRSKRARVYKGVKVIKGNSRKDGTGRFIFRILGPIWGHNKEHLLAQIQDKIDDTAKYLKTHFRTLKTATVKGRLKRAGTIRKIEFELTDEVSEALYDVLGPGETTLLRHKDGKRELVVHASNGIPERVYQHPKTFDTTSERLEKHFEEMRDYPVMTPLQVDAQIRNLHASQIINLLQANGADLYDLARLSGFTKELGKSLQRPDFREQAVSALMLEIIRLEKPQLAKAVEESPKLQAHLKNLISGG